MTDLPYKPFLDQVAFTQPLMWVVSTDTWETLDMTPATAGFVEWLDEDSYLSTISVDEHRAACREVVETGESQAASEWAKVNGSWRKIARTKSHAGGNRVLEMAQDVTRFDPRARWLARINLQSQRLELDDGGSISFNEFVVLHLLLKGFKHKRISRTLNISTKTVEYRISRIKIALRAETTEEMMLKVSSSGLIFLALIPIDLDDPAQTELALYSAVPN